MFVLLVLTRVIFEAQTYTFKRYDCYASKGTPCLPAFLPIFLRKEHYNTLSFIATVKRNMRHLILKCHPM